VFRETILAALAQAARAGDDHLVRKALSRADPSVAWWLRRRAAAQVRWASGCVSDPFDRGHVLRLAYLREARAADDLSFEDRTAVRAAFDEAVARARPAPRFWFVTFASVTLALAAAGAWWLSVVFTARFDPRTTPVGRALGPSVAEYVASVSQSRAHLRDGDRAAADFTRPRDRAQAAVSAQLGAETGGALVDLFRAYQAAALARERDPDLLRTLTAAVQRFNGDLRRAQQPYFMDFLEMDDGEPILTTYYVAQERSARVDQSEIRLLRVQRLDSLNRSLAVLGYTSPRLGAALVTLDRLERDFVLVVAPALREEGAAPLVDADARDSRAPWVGELERAAGATLRRDAQTYRSADVDHLVALLARREALFWELANLLARSKVAVVPPAHLVVEDRLEALEGIASRSALRQWRDLNEELDGGPMRRAFGRVLGLLADHVERHELQHQIDYRRGLLAVPAELRAVFGLGDTADVNPTGNAAQCRDELSADLAAIALGPDLASTELTLVSGAVFNSNSWMTPHAYAAAVLLPAVAKELGGPEGNLFRSGGFDRTRAKDLFVSIAAHSGADIAQAASRAYTRMFGSTLPAYELGPWTRARAWVH
jgi:hypothetical protein